MPKNKISFEHFRLFSWTISKIFLRFTASRKSVKLSSNIPWYVLYWFNLQTTRKSCSQPKMSEWIQANMQQNTIHRERDPYTAHCKTLLYRPLYEFEASGGKRLAKIITTFSCLDQSSKLAGHSRKWWGRKVPSKKRFTVLKRGKIRICLGAYNSPIQFPRAYLTTFF